MTVGTKSVLFGAHQFLIHPWFVAWGWWKLYGFPWDPRLWISFFVHDLGYIGKPNMDGKEGELHPYWGACLMGVLFGRKWFEFTLYHSRFLAKANNADMSRLCIADKLAIALTPTWLYLWLTSFTGEIHEYMERSEPRERSLLPIDTKYVGYNIYDPDPRQWYENVRKYLAEWVKTKHDFKP